MEVTPENAGDIATATAMVTSNHTSIDRNDLTYIADILTRIANVSKDQPTIEVSYHYA